MVKMIMVTRSIRAIFEVQGTTDRANRAAPINEDFRMWDVRLCPALLCETS